MSDPVLVAAFFDEPGLLAVRFAAGADGPSAAVGAFALRREPDARRGGCFGGCAGLMGAGLAIAMAAAAMRGCDDGGGSAPAMPPIPDAGAADHRQNAAWQAGLDQLADELAPLRADLRPWAVRTLLDVPREMARRGDPTGGWLAPSCSQADRLAHRRGAALAELLAEGGAGRELAVVLDLPGPQAVAAAAALAVHCDPVLAFDNLPHAAGVVPSAQTLGAVLHWRPLFAEGRAARAVAADRAPALFVLEGARLNPYANEVGRFDNRSVARLPDAEGLRALGVTRVLYVREEVGAVGEADDLNDLFVDLANAGFEVRHLALAAVEPPPAAAIERPLIENPSASPAAAAPAPARGAPWFWSRYGWYVPAGMPRTPGDDPDAGYRAAPRQTMFSGRPPAGSGLDGGLRQQAAVVSGLVRPQSRPAAPSRPSGSGGGSWSRSSSSHSG